jgi:hypothetical protein
MIELSIKSQQFANRSVLLYMASKTIFIVETQSS